MPLLKIVSHLQDQNVIAPATVSGRHHEGSMAVVIDMIKLS